MSASTDTQRAATSLSARELALWSSLLFLATTFVGSILGGRIGLGPDRILDFAFGGGFLVVAWGAVIWLLVKAPARPASMADVLVMLGLCLVGGLAQIEALPLAITGLGLWLFLKKDDETRAAGAVLLAIASQQFWGHILLGALSPELVQLDAAMVGEAMVQTVKGASWHDNIITAPSGYSIVVLEGCSSFSNVSTALLAWVAFGRLERAKWVKRDLVVGAVVVVSQVALNVARMYMMAQSDQGYLYWHEGGGKQIYVATASAAAVLISVIGAHWAGRTR